MAIRVVKSPIRKSEIIEIASEEFGEVVKAVVNVQKKTLWVILTFLLLP